MLTHTLIDFLMGETDGVPKDPNFIFRYGVLYYLVLLWCTVLPSTTLVTVLPSTTMVTVLLHLVCTALISSSFTGSTWP
jgi:hypothetical protein